MRRIVEGEGKRHGCSFCYAKEKLYYDLKKKYNVSRREDLPGELSKNTWCPFNDGCPYREELDKFPTYNKYEEQFKELDKLLMSLNRDPGSFNERYLKKKYRFGCLYDDHKFEVKTRTKRKAVEEARKKLIKLGIDDMDIKKLKIKKLKKGDPF